MIPIFGSMLILWGIAWYPAWDSPIWQRKAHVWLLRAGFAILAVWLLRLAYVEKGLWWPQ